MVNLSRNSLFVLALNFQFRHLHYCVWRNCCLLCKRFDSFYPRKEVVILGWSNSISIRNSVVVMAGPPCWEKTSFPSLSSFPSLATEIFCFNHVLSIYQSKGNSKNFMYYRFATSCIYVNSSFVEFLHTVYIRYHRYCLPVTVTSAFCQVSIFIYPDWNKSSKCFF